MLKIRFESLKQFENYYSSISSYVHDKCECGGIIEMCLSECEVKIGEYEIVVKECPILMCQACNKSFLGNCIPQMLYENYFDMEHNNVFKAQITTLNDQKFEFAKNKDFKYDCRDLNIPALNIDMDPTHSVGFSCPVFFDKKVLNIFLFDNDYELDLFSETYGSIAKKGTNGWPFEWHIVFGINSNGKVVIFLGDLDQIDDDDRAVLWLKSYNIDSDHFIVGSELYEAQLNCKFSESIKEKQLIKLRNAFFEKIKLKYAIDLFHLEEAVELLAKDLKKPINYTKEEVKNNIVLLDNLLNDAVDLSALKELYKKTAVDIPKNFGDLKTIKTMNGILLTKLTQAETDSIVSPLYNLKDLRDCFSHILPKEHVEKIQKRIIESYGIDSFTQYEKIYNILIERLLNLFKYLNLSDI